MELESMIALFIEKRKELNTSLAKVEALSRQLEELKSGINGSNSFRLTNTLNRPLNEKFDDLEKLRQNLLAQNRLNEQQNITLIHKRKSLMQRKCEIAGIDERINELQQRLAKKRMLNQQLSSQMKPRTGVAYGLPNDSLNSGNPRLRSSVGPCNTLRLNNYNRPISANVAAVEPFQRHSQPNNYGQSSYEKRDENIDPSDDITSSKQNSYKYQTLPYKNKLEGKYVPTRMNSSPLSSAITTTTINSNHNDNENNSINLGLGSEKIGHSESMERFGEAIPCLDGMPLADVAGANGNILSIPKNKMILRERPSPSGSIGSSSYHVPVRYSPQKKPLDNSSKQSSNNHYNNIRPVADEPTYDYYNINYRAETNSGYDDSNAKYPSELNVIDSIRKIPRLADHHSESKKITQEEMPNNNIDQISNTSLDGGEKTSSFGQLPPAPSLSSSSSSSSSTTTTTTASSSSTSPSPSSISISQSTSTTTNTTASSSAANINGNRDSRSLTPSKQPISTRLISTNYTPSLGNLNSSTTDHNRKDSPDRSELTEKPVPDNHNNSFINSSIRNNTTDSQDNHKIPSSFYNHSLPSSTTIYSPYTSNNNHSRNYNDANISSVPQHSSNSVYSSGFNKNGYFSSQEPSNNQNSPRSNNEKISNMTVRRLPTEKEASDSTRSSLFGANMEENTPARNHSAGEDESPYPSSEEAENKGDCKQGKDWYSIKRRPVVADNKMEKELENAGSGENNRPSKQNDELEDEKKVTWSNKKRSWSKTTDDLKSQSKESYNSSETKNSDQAKKSFENLNGNHNKDAKKNNKMFTDDRVYSESNVEMLENGENNKTKSLLKKDGRDHEGLTRRVSFDPLALLLDAALEGELELVKKTSKIQNVSAANDEGITALHNTICAGHFEIVKYLVEIGCDVNAPDSDGWTPLHCAASCNNLTMVKYLVEHGACIFATTFPDRETAAEKCEEGEEGFDGCSQYLLHIQEGLGIMNAAIVYAVYDYEAQSSDELSFKDGDAMTILRRGDEEEKDWWWARSNDKEGYVPRNLLGLYPRVKVNKDIKDAMD